MYLKKINLKNKYALVTGAGKGLGRACSIAMAEAGATIIGLSRTSSDLDKLEKDIKKVKSKLIKINCDVMDYKDLSKKLKKIKIIDILVNNAGTSIRKPPEKLTPEDWKYVMDVNLTSIHYFSSLIFDQMKNNNGGKIINIGSMMTIFGAGHASVYAASKGGVVQYSKSCAIAWAEHNIQVNSILPGYITTNMTDGFKKNFPKDADLVTSRIPAGRWGVPDDLAGTAIFLASSASDFVTGAFIPVDGGYSIR